MTSDLTPSLRRMRMDAFSIFQDALKVVLPEILVHQHLKLKDTKLLSGNLSFDLSRLRHIYVVGAGKASAAMASAVESILPGRITDGLVNVKYGHTAPVAAVRLVQAGHPVPDATGLRGAKEILSLVANAGAQDLVVCLISGGGSALLPFPASGLTLSQKQETTQALLACGATIHEINTIRKHLSAIKGGQLAKAAYPAPMITLILSDVVGDDLDVIASGPTVPDHSTYGDCLGVIEKYELIRKVPEAVLLHLQKGAEGLLPETPKPKETLFKSIHNIIIGTNRDALLAARHSAAEKGYNPLILSASVEGETRQVAHAQAAVAKKVLSNADPIAPPACILSGGETTVTLHGTGKGGRNQEFVLSAAIEIDSIGDVVVFSAGTDGTDGPTDAAGAVADSETVGRSGKIGMDPLSYLNNNDAYSFFKKLDDLVMTGPTNTNVMDLRMILIA